MAFPASWESHRHIKVQMRHCALKQNMKVSVHFNSFSSPFLRKWILSCHHIYLPQVTVYPLCLWLWLVEVTASVPWCLETRLTLSSTAHLSLQTGVHKMFGHPFVCQVVSNFLSVFKSLKLFACMFIYSTKWHFLCFSPLQVSAVPRSSPLRPLLSLLHRSLG